MMYWLLHLYQQMKQGSTMKSYYVYILASYRNGTLYLGVTSNLIQRVYQHKYGLIKGFSSKYNVNDLVYYEIHSEVTEAILREKQLKDWNRLWKICLIEKFNPDWDDLFDEIIA